MMEVIFNIWGQSFLRPSDPPPLPCHSGLLGTPQSLWAITIPHLNCGGPVAMPNCILWLKCISFLSLRLSACLCIYLSFPSLVPLKLGSKSERIIKPLLLLEKKMNDGRKNKNKTGGDLQTRRDMHVHALTHKSNDEPRSPPRARTWINVTGVIISFITVLDLFR